MATGPASEIALNRSLVSSGPSQPLLSQLLQGHTEKMTQESTGRSDSRSVRRRLWPFSNTNYTESEYKPKSHQWPFLTILICVLLLLAGLLELAVQKLPNQAERDPSISRRESRWPKRSETIDLISDLSTTMATVQPTDGDTATDCTTTVTVPYTATTVSAGTGRRLTITKTATETTNATETIETTFRTVITSTVLVTPNALVTPPPQLARRACVTVFTTPRPTTIVTVIVGDYITDGTVTLTSTITTVLTRTEVEVEPLTVTLPFTDSIVVAPAPTSTPQLPSQASEETFKTTSTQKTEGNANPTTQVIGHSTDELSQTNQITLTLSQPGTLGGNTVVVVPGTAQASGSGLILSNPASASRPGGIAITQGPTATWSAITSVETDSNGIPTATTTQAAIYVNMVTTLTNAEGEPTATLAYSGWIMTQTTVMTNSLGIPTLTATSSIFAIPYTTVLRDSLGHPTATSTLSSTILMATGTSPKSQANEGGQSGGLVVTTLSDARGTPTRTLTLVSGTHSTAVATLTDANGVPTATITYTPDPSSGETITLTDSNGRPTATVTAVPGPETTAVVLTSTSVYAISAGEYFTGMFGSTLIAIIIAIPVRIVDLNAKRLQPFHAMTHARGASAATSLLMSTGGKDAILASIRSMASGDGLLSITTLLTIISALLAPLSSEAISIDLHGDCFEGSGNGKNCAMTLAVSAKPARATEGMLIGMAVLILVVLVILRRWHSGVSQDPWSLTSIDSLSRHPVMQQMLTSVKPTAGKVSRSAFEKVLGDTRFRLGHFDLNDERAYGVVPIQPEVSSTGPAPRFPGPSPTTTNYAEEGNFPAHSGVNPPIFALGRIGLLLHLLFLLGLLILIVVYNNTGGDTSFEWFMDTETFGVRFFFTLLGVISTYLFSSVFNGICTLLPYKHIPGPFHPTWASALDTPPPTHAFEGVYVAARARPRLHLLFVVSVLSLMSEFLPVLLANVPYRTSQTLLTHLVCTWLCVGILCMLILLVLYLLLFVRWPALPTDVRTIAGAAWYLVRGADYGTTMSYHKNGKVIGGDHAEEGLINNRSSSEG